MCEKEIRERCAFGCFCSCWSFYKHITSPPSEWRFRKKKFRVCVCVCALVHGKINFKRRWKMRQNEKSKKKSKRLGVVNVLGKMQPWHLIRITSGAEDWQTSTMIIRRFLVLLGDNLNKKKKKFNISFKIIKDEATRVVYVGVVQNVRLSGFRIKNWSAST